MRTLNLFLLFFFLFALNSYSHECEQEYGSGYERGYEEGSNPPSRDY